MPDEELCSAYGLENRVANLPGGRGPFDDLPLRARQTARNEIDRRHLIPQRDWPIIEAGRIDYGMQRCSVLAAWYKPNSASRTRSGNTDVEMWVYNSGRIAGFRGGSVFTVTSPR
jgi:hypothetical protein